MEGVPLFEVSKLLRHASIQMTERYAHLAPDHLHDAVASIKFSAHQLGVPAPFALKNEFEDPSHAAVVVFDLMTSMMLTIVLSGLLQRLAFIVGHIQLLGRCYESTFHPGRV